MKLKDSIIVLLITAAISIVGNYVGYKTNMIEAIPGVLILVAMAAAGIVLHKIIPFKIPSVAYIVTLSTLLTVPGVPGAAVISGYVAKVNFLALATPILAYAGIYTGKNLDSLKKTGWRIVVLALFVMVGTYLGSAIIADIILRMLGQI
jgi:NhaP-type Na+/H+ or K+/H+ antiporter